jgi:hypothetical protein
MKSRVRLLSLVVSSTLILLTTGATLVVLGIFNEALNWDIFGPRLEAVLYGLFGSCMALAGFGVAMSVILAMQESVKDFKKFVQSRTQEQTDTEAPRRAYAGRMLAIVGGMVLLVLICSTINHAVLTHRCSVFKKLASEQLVNFEPLIMEKVAAFDMPPQSNVPRQIYDVIRSIDNLDFVQRTTLYVPDPVEANAMWGFTAWRSAYSNQDGFAKFYVAKDFEKAMRRAADGDSEALSKMNRHDEFIWYRVLDGANGHSRPVMRVDGNPRANLREYRMGL